MIVAGACVQGTAHLASGQGCQDAFKAVDVGDAAVLAVSDGAGSRDRSALGAHIAVDAACRLLARGLPEVTAEPEVWTRWVAERGRRVVEEYLRAVAGVLGGGAGAGAACVMGADASAAGRRAVSTEVSTDTDATSRPARVPDAESRPAGDRVATGRPAEDPDAESRPAAGVEAPAADPGALAATLTAAVVAPPWTAFVSLGDGFGTLLTRDDRSHLVLPPPTGPASFLSSPGAALRVRTFVVWEPELAGVVLATDGCAALALDHPCVHRLPLEAGPLPAAGFFLGLAATLRENGGDAEPLRRRLSGPEAGRTGDDLTVLCALVEGG
ncbi:protein phosphatase 2C domain-containing protein [Streptomyces flavofungini]|uniref:protein phosphatase 2C domain-containing protein n=1 Tax=Streptomyces flavofungini TaxID=68200 RepID=UPI0025AF7718|nr:protein phosphatase 2C domain-containing protein [Streptomyces flavofungini]WJV44697.1 protein phosphatase 2C domain-containing protein [Streptomyces flavofungini]